MRWVIPFPYVLSEGNIFFTFIVVTEYYEHLFNKHTPSRLNEHHWCVVKKY